MSTSTTTPQLQASVICEDVRQEVNGSQTLVGVLTIIPAAKTPVGVLKLCVWTRWMNGTGKFKQTAKIVAPDQRTVLGEASVDFEMKGGNSQATNVNFFAGLQFKDFGMHHVEVALDGRLVARYPLVVAQTRQQAPAAVPAPAPAAAAKTTGTKK